MKYIFWNLVTGRRNVFTPDSSIFDDYKCWYVSDFLAVARDMMDFPNNDPRLAEIIEERKRAVVIHMDVSNSRSLLLLGTDMVFVRARTETAGR